jgi:phosphate transport system substrate-binding protein
MKILTQKFFIILGLIGIIFIASCGKNDESVKKDTHELLGAGATFPYPLYSKMFDSYNKEKNIKVNYQSVGSGAGIQQLTNKTVDFGASDAFMTDEELSKTPAPVIHIPICLGAVAVTYNLPDNPMLKLTPEVIAGIFSGKITKWNDSKIAGLNTDVKLPDIAINVIHRSDGSGTTFVFTDYLAKASAEWKSSPGAGKSINWPVGLGAKGNEGVGGLVKQTPGSIGYVELIYAMQNKMSMASVKNSKGNFIVPSLATTNAAANVNLPEDTRISLTNSDADQGYPIVSFTWILLYKEQKYNDRSEERAKELVKLLWWMTHDGQQYAEPLQYAKLPDEAVKKVEALLKSVTYSGKKIME